jgi:hypothetical protein
MTVIDSQVHAYEANTPNRPWHSVPNWPDHVTGDEMVAAMDKVGVDGAIFISAFSMYRYDASYAVEVQRAHPGRFAIVKPVDPDDPAVADIVADWKSTPGAVHAADSPTAKRRGAGSGGNCRPIGSFRISRISALLPCVTNARLLRSRRSDSVCVRRACSGRHHNGCICRLH